MAGVERMRVEFGYAGVYIWYPGKARPEMHESNFAAHRAMANWRPPGLTIWQRIVCFACGTGPMVYASQRRGGKPMYWPPRWLLGDRNAP